MPENGSHSCRQHSTFSSQSQKTETRKQTETAPPFSFSVSVSHLCLISLCLSQLTASPMILLQRPHVEQPLAQAGDPLGRGFGGGNSRKVRHPTLQGAAADGERIGHRLSPFGGVDHQRDRADADGI